MKAKKILILGVTGMLGHKLFFQLSKNDKYDVYATARRADGLSQWFPEELQNKIRSDVHVENIDTVKNVLASIKPQIVINCIGLIKQNPSANDPLSSITINAQFPHILSMLCKTADARLVHISTDCVFDGGKGNYNENDQSNATDIYGRTKYLGEVLYPRCLTLRTSIIGHELNSQLGLIEWFLAQGTKVRGYTNAIYTGFPTIELARIIDKFVLPVDGMDGLYHLSSEPISKYEILELVMKKYNKSIRIEPFNDFRSNRSLNSSFFRSKFGYTPPSWNELIDTMYKDYISSPYYRHTIV